MMVITSITFYLIFNVFSTSAKYLFPEHSLIFSHPENSSQAHFGYSVQLQALKNEESRLIVGAPRSDDIYNQNLNEPGVVFSCSLSKDLKCKQLNFDARNDGILIRGKNHSCLGYSLDVSSDGRMVACAPKWVNYYISTGLPLRMNGMCYYMNEDNKQPTQNNIQNLIPLNDTDLQYDQLSYNYIFGETGFSSHLIDKKDSVVLTAVGLRNWTGSVIQYDQIDNKGSQNFVVTPKNIRKLETYSYFGYSLTSGHFNSSDLSQIYYVSGAPRSDNLTGMVYIYDELKDYQTFSKHYEFPGQQFGEYFGASLAVADLNGDKIDDVIIGAPFHSTDDRDEIGRIYTYITKTYDRIIRFKKMHVEFMGENRRDRFGTSISSLGDINKDGFADIAVGAPFHDDVGAVYIYLGQNSNNPLKLDQKIYASEHFPFLRGFGYSLSRGVDIDNNYNNDLAIGSFSSGHAVVIKSKPIIRISPFLSADIKQVDINTRKFTLTKCFKYTSKDIPSDLQIRTTVTTEKSLKIFNDKNLHISEEIFKKDEEKCEIINARIINQQISNDIKLVFNYDIISKKGSEFCKECPIDETSEKSIELIIPFASGCKDIICRPNLKLYASFSFSKQSFIIGSSNEIEVIITIENSGENSFGTKLLIETNPKQITIANLENHCLSSKNHASCSFNTLTANSKKIMRFILNVENLLITDKELNVLFFASSNSEDIDNTDNNVTLSLPVSTDIKYNIESSSNPESIIISDNITVAKFVHEFHIESIGETDLEFLNINILIPYKYNNEKMINNIDISGCIPDTEEKIIATKEIISNDVNEKMINLNCSSTQVENLECRKIKCEIKEDSKTQLERSKIKINFEVNIPMFLDETLSIFLVTSVQTDSEYFSAQSYARSSLIPIPKTASLTLNIIIGLVVGLILIIIIGFILYKYGCFKKKKLPKPENQALIDNKDNQDQPGTSKQPDESVKNEETGTVFVENEIYKESE